jgi:TQXA domain-containing protein/LPXTG-motif cell wall-anchored protein
VGRISVGRWGRLGVAVMLGGLMSFTAAGVAAAAETTTTPVTGTAGVEKDGNGEVSYPLFDEGGTQHDAALITLTIGGKTVEAYCIDLKNDLDGGGKYQETAWQASAVKNLDKVQWILVHSFPNVTPQKVLDAAGATALAPQGASEQELKLLVYAATQGAIWNFSDDFNLGAYNGKANAPEAKSYPAVEKVYHYLVDNAGSAPEPAPTLSIAPANVTGEIGTKLGPYTVTSSQPATLSATGGKIVDANGAEIAGPVANGEKFWLTSDTAGKVTVDAKAEGMVPIGRVFTATRKTTAKNVAKKFQKIILAGVAKTELIAHAAGTVTPKAAPAPTLPVTGASAVGAAVGGLVLLGGGGVLVAVLRRRRINFTA